MKEYDVLIIGLGANGSSAAWHLAKNGVAVCGIDRFRPPHHFGSSHGQSRIIRQAYYESPMYVPLIKAAYLVWEELEKISKKKLFLRTGGLMLGAEHSAVIQGSKLSASLHDLQYEYLSNEQIIERFPAMLPAKETVGILEKHAGILFPEACIEAFLGQAQSHGADLKFNETVIKITAGAAQVTVQTDKQIYTANKLIVAAGAWIKALLPELDLPLVVERQVLYWFKNKDQHEQVFLTPDHLPVFIWEYSPGKMFYGFGDLGDGIKIAYHHAGKKILPDELINNVSQEEIEHMSSIIKKYFVMDAAFNYATTCMYTNTPDGDFMLDHHPHHSNIIVASPCSGHGFKFASITGKILAQMATDQRADFPLGPFKLSRFK